TFVGDDDALADLCRIGDLLGRGGACSRRPLFPRRGPFLAPFNPPPLALSQPLRPPLLGRLLRLGLMGLTRSLKAPLLLPRKIILRIRLSFDSRLRGSLLIRRLL